MADRTDVDRPDGRPERGQRAEQRPHDGQPLVGQGGDLDVEPAVDPGALEAGASFASFSVVQDPPGTTRSALAHPSEFRCCSYPGTEALGADGDGIVDHFRAGNPVIVREHLRDETVRAREAAELLDTFTTVGSDGAFAFDEAASARALAIDAPTYQSVDSILRTGLDGQPLRPPSLDRRHRAGSTPTSAARPTRSPAPIQTFERFQGKLCVWENAYKRGPDRQAVGRLTPCREYLATLV